MRAYAQAACAASQHAASDVQPLQKQISILESKVNSLQDDLAARGAKSVAHAELLPQEGRTVEKRCHGTRGGGGEGDGEEGDSEHASVSSEVPVQDQTRSKRIRYKPASTDMK